LALSHFSSKTKTKNLKTIPFFELLPDVNSVTKRKKKKKLVLSKPCRCPRLFAKATNNGSQGCENPFSTELVRKPFYFKHWLKIVYLHFYIFRCYQCLRFGKVNFT